MGHQKYMLVEDVEVAYEGLSEMKFFSIDSYALSDETCC